MGYSYQGPTREVDNTYALYDNLSWTRGRHNLKFGFYFSPYQNNTVYDFFVNGAFDFYGPSTGVGSGFDLADFLLGLPGRFPGVRQGALQHSLGPIRGLRAGYLEGIPAPDADAGHAL